MDTSGRIIWAKSSQRIQQANVLSKNAAEDGITLKLSISDLGVCDFNAQTILHNSDGRYMAICSEHEYAIYSTTLEKTYAFGPAQEFIWSHDSSMYAIRNGPSQVKIFKDFKEIKLFESDFGIEKIFGGQLMGVQNVNGYLNVYDWQTTAIIRKFPKAFSQFNIFWSENGKLVCISSESQSNFYKYNRKLIGDVPELTYKYNPEHVFEFQCYISETVNTGIWVRDCFIYTNSLNELKYCVRGNTRQISDLERKMYLLGYIPDKERLYLGDKELNVVSYSLLLTELQYPPVRKYFFFTANKCKTINDRLFLGQIW